MSDLAPLTAFGRTEARRHRSGPVVLSENIGIGLASLAMPRSATVPHVGDLRLPDPGCWVEGNDRSAFWTGPGQWMVAVVDSADTDLERELKAAVPEAAVTGQTDGWVVLEIVSEAGPRPIERILEKLVNLDPARLGPGSATRTGLDHMSVFVIRRTATAVDVLGMRSMAASLWHKLEATVSGVAEGWH